MQGIWGSRPLVSRIMKKKNFRSVVVRKFRQTSNSDHKYALVENKLNQDFITTSYNQVWVSGITYIRTGQGWNYLTTVIDLFDGNVIGWQLSNNLTAKDTVIPALNKACSNRSLAAGQSVIFHSDRGIQYACNEFKQFIKKHRWISQFMRGKGNCYDNAVAENFFKTLKTELIYQNHYSTRNDAYKTVFEYIEAFYNTNRRHSHLNYLTINEFNKLYKFKYKKVA